MWRRSRPSAARTWPLRGSASPRGLRTRYSATLLVSRRSPKGRGSEQSQPDTVLEGAPLHTPSFEGGAEDLMAQPDGGSGGGVGTGGPSPGRESKWVLRSWTPCGGGSVGTALPGSSPPWLSRPGWHTVFLGSGCSGGRKTGQRCPRPRVQRSVLQDLERQHAHIGIMVEFSTALMSKLDGINRHSFNSFRLRVGEALGRTAPWLRVGLCSPASWQPHSVGCMLPSV